MGFYTTQELLQIPIPPWLIYKILPGYGLALLYGNPGSGKSFVALDWALSVSTGQSWAGYPVQQGHVVYIASEGGEGIKKRVRAWMDAAGHQDLPNVLWYLDTLDFRDHDLVAAFLDTLEGRYPGRRTFYPEVQEWHTIGGLDLRLLVVDTLARNFDGDENSNIEMGTLIEALSAFGKETGALVLLIHHNNALGTRERGHSSLRGAIDVAFECVGVYDGATNTLQEVILTNDKQKDDARAPSLSFTPTPIVLTAFGPDEQGEPLSTILLTPKAAEDSVVLSRICTYLQGKRASQGDILKALAPLSHTTVRQALARGVAEGIIRLRVVARGTHEYRLA